MIKLYLLLVTFFIFNDLYCQNKVVFSDTLRFDWHLFNSLKLSDSKNGAEIACGVDINIVEEYSDSLIIEVNSFMNKSLSWVDSRHMTKEALNHEFGHFKLMEIYGRILRCQLLNRDFTYYNYEITKDSLRQLVFDEFILMSQKYDNETDYHRNQKSQHIWNVMINNTLISLNNYKYPLLKLNMVFYDASKNENINRKSRCSCWNTLNNLKH